MSSLQQLSNTLKRLASAEHYLFTPADLHGALPQHSKAALQVVLGRAVKAKVLERVCQGLYLYPDAYISDGLLLYRAAARLRASDFNYLSLESVLSDAGVISQIPLAWITLMSSGRNRLVDCGRFGRIEFIHTQRTAAALVEQLSWDTQAQVWRASVPLALRDMQHTKRSLELIDREVLSEFV